MPICKLVFVYGTLKKDFGNHRVLSNSELVGKGVTIQDHFTMIDGGFPYVYNEGICHVSGELYIVRREDVMHNLDMLEGVPNHYQHETVSVKTADGLTFEDVTMYVASPRIKEGLKVRAHDRIITPDENNNVSWRE